MKRRSAFIISLILTIILLVNFIFLNNIKEKKTFILYRVIDGDTIETATSEKIRLANINAPEKNIPNSEISSNFLRQFTNQTLEYEPIKTEKYGRTLARIYKEEYINLRLVEEGFASKFLVEENEKSLFSKAEKRAVQNQRGIWRHSHFFGCISAEILPEEEILILKNDCNPSPKKIIIKDESRKTFIIQEPLNEQIRVHSKNGINNETDLFWNSSSNVWNNDRDTIYIFDKDWNLIFHDDYGY